MRKLWKLRKECLTHVAVLLLVTAVFAAIATQARAGGGLLSETIKDKYGDSVTVKTNAEQLDFTGLVAEEKPAETGMFDAVQNAAKKLLQPSAPQPAYDASINTALGKMNLSKETLQKWIDQHPKSALKEIEKMPPARQAKVANIATFIRSVNGRIDHKTIWREAAAIVHLCAKYNISTELAVGVAKAESTFDPTLISKSGARGVMQVMWKYHGGMLQAKGIAASAEQLSDPERGIEAGVLLLSRYVEAYGSIQNALSRYYGKVSTTYVKKIDRNVAMLEQHSSKTGF